MRNVKKGIALLITAMFVIVITVAIGFTLKYINESAKYVEQESTMYQNFIFAEDVLNLLENSAQLQEAVQDDDPNNLFVFLQTSGFVTFEYAGVRLVVNIQSARDRFSINDMNNTQKVYLGEFLNRYNVRAEYLDLLQDSISGISETGYYNSRLFDINPELFRDYIASEKQLKKINRFYANEYRDDALEKVPFSQLFYFTQGENNNSIDLNYATANTFELITGIDPDRAKLLASNEVVYTTLDDFYEKAALTDYEKQRLQKFRPSVFEPYLYIKMDIIKDNLISHMSFEYDIKEKKGYNFVYEI